MNYGDKKSNNFIIIKHFYQQERDLHTEIKFIFLSSDPDELVDQLILIVLEEVRGNDNSILS